MDMEYFEGVNQCVKQLLFQETLSDLFICVAKQKLLREIRNPVGIDVDDAIKKLVRPSVVRRLVPQFVNQFVDLTVVPADQNRFTAKLFLPQFFYKFLSVLVGVHRADIQPHLVCRRPDGLVRPRRIPGRCGGKHEIRTDDFREQL